MRMQALEEVNIKIMADQLVYWLTCLLVEWRLFNLSCNVNVSIHAEKTWRLKTRL